MGSDAIAIFGLKLDLPKGGAERIGASTGLGSEGNVKRAEAGKKAFFGGWEPGTVFGPAAHFAAEDLKIGPLNT